MNFEEQSIILKLVSGETILCQVISDTDKNMIIRDPYEIRIHCTQTTEGIRSMTYYADWFLSSKSRIHMIRKEHVMSAAIPDDKTQQEYAEMIDHRNGNPEKNLDHSSGFKWDDLNYKPDNDVPDRN